MCDVFCGISCDRCGEVNEVSDMTLLETSTGIGEAVCLPCVQDEADAGESVNIIPLD